MAPKVLRAQPEKTKGERKPQKSVWFGNPYKIRLDIKTLLSQGFCTAKSIPSITIDPCHTPWDIFII